MLGIRHFYFRIQSPALFTMLTSISPLPFSRFKCVTKRTQSILANIKHLLPLHQRIVPNVIPLQPLFSSQPWKQRTQVEPKCCSKLSLCPSTSWKRSFYIVRWICHHSSERTVFRHCSVQDKSRKGQGLLSHCFKADRKHPTRALPLILINIVLFKFGYRFIAQHYRLYRMHSSRRMLSPVLSLRSNTFYTQLVSATVSFSSK